MSKVYVFDLDNTLLLRKVDTCYKYKYESNLKEFLENLKSKNHILAIASHNRSPRYYLKEMEIFELFDYIIGEYPREKSDMIVEILENVKGKKEDVVFFDDLNFNIEETKKNGIISIKVDPLKGLDFESILF